MENAQRQSGGFERGSLSRNDAFELTSQIAELTTAGIPLASGLKALAQEMPSKRLAHRIGRLSEYLQQGIPLDRAAAMPDVALPRYLLALLACGIKSDRLGIVLEQFLNHERLRQDLRHYIWSAIAYPLLLVTALAIWLVFVTNVLLGEFVKIFTDFEVELPLATQSLIGMSEYMPQIALTTASAFATVAILAVFFGRTRVVSDLFAALPLLGPLWVHRGLAEFSDLLGLFIRYGIPLPESLELTATGLSDGALAAACRHSARLAKAGLPLAECLRQVPTFPPTLHAIVEWGDRENAPEEALSSASDWFRQRCDLQSDMLSVVIPPIAFLLVIAVIVHVSQALLLPLIKLIQALT